MYQQPTYPIVQFLLRHGKALAIAIAVLLALAAIAGAWVSGLVWVGVLGLVVAAVIWLLLQSYVEVLAIIADTLLPK